MACSLGSNTRIMQGLLKRTMAHRCARHPCPRAAGAWLAQFPAAGHAFFSQLLEPVAATLDVFLQNAPPTAAAEEARPALEGASAQVCAGASASA